MMEKFSLYYKENNEAATWKTSDAIKLRNTLKLRGHNVTQIYHDPEENFLFLEIENPYHLSKTNNTDKYLNVKYIISKKIIKIFFSFYPFQNRGLIQNINFDFTIKHESVEDVINEIIDTFDYVVKNLEKLIIEKYPESIKGMENPSLWSQKYVIDKFGPSAFLWINNPDPEIEKKYKYMKAMNRAGIFESKEPSDLSLNHNLFRIERMINKMGHRVKSVSHLGYDEYFKVLLEIKTSAPIINNDRELILEIKPEQVRLTYRGMTSLTNEKLFVNDVYDFNNQEDFTFRLDKIKSMIIGMFQNVEKRIMKQDVDNIKYLDNPSRWAQDLAIDKLGPSIVTRIKNIDPDLKEKYKYIFGLSRSGILEYYPDIVENNTVDEIDKYYDLPIEDHKQKIWQAIGKDRRSFKDEQEYLQEIYNRTKSLSLVLVKTIEKWIDSIDLEAELAELGFGFASGHFQKLIDYPSNFEARFNEETWKKIGRIASKDFKEFLSQDVNFKKAYDKWRDQGKTYYKGLIGWNGYHAADRVDISRKMSDLTGQVADYFYEILKKYIVDKILGQKWFQNLLANDDLKYALIFNNIDQEDQEKYIERDKSLFFRMKNLHPEVLKKYKYLTTLNKSGII